MQLTLRVALVISDDGLEEVESVLRSEDLHVQADVLGNRATQLNSLLTKSEEHTEVVNRFELDDTYIFSTSSIRCTSW